MPDPLLRYESPAPPAEHRPAGPRLSAAELREQELCNAMATAACRLVEAMRHCDADPTTRLNQLEYVADVAAFHLARLKLDEQAT